MIDHVLRPEPPLDKYVECLWYSDAARNTSERALPTGAVDLIVKLGTLDHGEPAVVRGAYTRYFVLEPRERAPIVGVHFRPGGAAPFLRVPISEIMDQRADLDHFWGREAGLLRERLQEQTSPQRVLDVLQATLLQRLRNAAPVHSMIDVAIRQFESSPGLAQVRDVCQASGYSAKRFIRLFHDRVGLTPKVFCRILRFQSVLDALAGERQVAGAALAMDCGYFDQPHLIRDFRLFTGVTPRQYRPVAADRKNHLQLGVDQRN